MLCLVKVAGDDHTAQTNAQLEQAGEDEPSLGLPLCLLWSEVHIADREHCVSASFLESSLATGTFYGRRRNPDSMLSKLYADRRELVSSPFFVHVSIAVREVLLECLQRGRIFWEMRSVKLAGSVVTDAE